MIETSISRLADVLAVEERVYRDLRELLSEERGRMLDLDAESLYGLATRKEVLAEEGRLVLEARTRAVDHLAKSTGISGPGTTLTQLCESLGDAARPLREAQSRLLAIVGAVRELSEANQKMGGDRLTDVQTTLKLLGRLVPLVSENASGMKSGIVAGLGSEGNALDPGREPPHRSGSLVRRSA